MQFSRGVSNSSPQIINFDTFQYRKYVNGENGTKNNNVEKRRIADYLFVVNIITNTIEEYYYM